MILCSIYDSLVLFNFVAMLKLTKPTIKDRIVDFSFCTSLTDAFI